MDIYIVEKGDTIESIGRNYNIPVIEIIKANNLEAPYLLKEGQSLTIPTGLYNIFNYYTVKKGDNLYKLATTNNITVDLLANVNGLEKDEYIYEGQTLLVPKTDVSLYITKTGDTIEDVSEFFDAPTPDVIYSNNSIYLLPGQLIIYRKSWFFNENMLKLKPLEKWYIILVDKSYEGGAKNPLKSILKVLSNCFIRPGWGDVKKKEFMGAHNGIW